VLEAAVGLKSILVVEDKQIHREAVERLLKCEYSVTVAADRESAESRLAQTFDLVILDSNIPSKDGSEASREESWTFLEAFRKRSEAPVIMVVSYPVDKAFRSKAKNFNVAAILEKPFLRAELRSAVKKSFADSPFPSDR
jgi:CheY-like chemotaxis protein